MGTASERGWPAFADGEEGMSRYTCALVKAIKRCGHTSKMSDVLLSAADAVVAKYRDAQRPETLHSLAGVAEGVFFPSLHGLQMVLDPGPESPCSPIRVGEIVTKVLDVHKQQVRKLVCRFAALYIS